MFIMFRSTRLLFAISVLILASLACQAMAGGDAPAAPADPVEQGQPVVPEEPAATPVDEPVQPEQPAAPEPAAGLGIETEFPFPDDVHSCMDLGSSGVMCQTDKSLEEVLEFYRDAFAASGYTEREINTVIADTVLSLVFDGHESGQAIVLQCVDLGTGSASITLRFEDV
jgi:hypothetical protein